MELCVRLLSSVALNVVTRSVWYRPNLLKLDQGLKLGLSFSAA